MPVAAGLLPLFSWIIAGLDLRLWLGAGGAAQSPGRGIWS